MLIFSFCQGCWKQVRIAYAGTCACMCKCVCVLGLLMTRQRPSVYLCVFVLCQARESLSTVSVLLNPLNRVASLLPFYFSLFFSLTLYHIFSFIKPFCASLPKFKNLVHSVSLSSFTEKGCSNLGYVLYLQRISFAIVLMSTLWVPLPLCLSNTNYYLVVLCQIDLSCLCLEFEIRSDS